MKTVCVFTGSSTGNRAEYVDAARGFGRALASRGIALVYGGGHVGLMGVIADEVLAGGGRAIGVITEALLAKEVGHKGLTELRVVKTMHERKALMADIAEGFVAMPGGFGTLDEFFEAITWAQLGIHRKPCGLLNTHRYYDRLLDFIDHAVAEGGASAGRHVGASSAGGREVDHSGAALRDRPLTKGQTSETAFVGLSLSKWSVP